MTGPAPHGSILEGRGPVGDVLVLFGVTGDLARKMIFPALCP